MLPFVSCQPRPHLLLCSEWWCAVYSCTRLGNCKIELIIYNHYHSRCRNGGVYFLTLRLLSVLPLGQRDSRNSTSYKRTTSFLFNVRMFIESYCIRSLTSKRYLSECEYKEHKVKFYVQQFDVVSLYSTWSIVI